MNGTLLINFETFPRECVNKETLKQWATVGCHVYVWTTFLLLEQTLATLPLMGVNFHLLIPVCMPFQSNRESSAKRGIEDVAMYLVLGFYGKPMLKFVGIGKRNWIDATNCKVIINHKPQLVYELLQLMSPKPHAEWEASEPHAVLEGWDVIISKRHNRNE